MTGLLEINNQRANDYHADRRGFLKLGGIAIAALGFWTPSLAKAAASSAANVAPKGRAITLVAAHTSEKFSGEYWYDGKYLPDAFSEIKMVMRDHRNNEKFPIDPRLMDVIYVLQNRIGMIKPVHVVSGYRSPQTNAMLRRTTEGVARNSLHMSGQAVDIRIPGVSLSSVRNTALDLQSGGVGYYPKSDFVHMDTGRVRTW